MCYAQLKQWVNGPRTTESEDEWDARGKRFSADVWGTYILNNYDVSDAEDLQLAFDEVGSTIDIDYDTALDIFDNWEGREDWESWVEQDEETNELADALAAFQSAQEQFKKKYTYARQERARLSDDGFAKRWWACLKTQQTLEFFASLIGSPVANCRARANKLGLPDLDRKITRWKYEGILQSALKELGTNAIPQWTTPDCRGKRLLRWDFGGTRPSDGQRYLVEYHGEQHYDRDAFKAWVEESQVQDSYEAQQERDALKHSYCTAFNVLYLVIDCSQKDNIKQVLAKWLKENGII